MAASKQRERSICHRATRRSGRTSAPHLLRKLFPQFTPSSRTVAVAGRIYDRIMFKFAESVVDCAWFSAHIHASDQSASGTFAKAILTPIARSDFAVRSKLTLLKNGIT
jgi:hypothetical protein